MFRKTFKKINYFFGLLGVFLLLAGCSVNLQQGDLDKVPLTTEKYSFFGNIAFVYGGDTLELSQDLLRAYTAAAPAESYPRESCRGNAEIVADVRQESPKSAWTLGAVIIPFWPILPVDETLSYSLKARIYCNGTLVKHVELREQERFAATFYGRMRSDLINGVSREMHRKLVQRLAFELQDNRKADLNSVLSFNVKN